MQPHGGPTRRLTKGDAQTTMSHKPPLRLYLFGHVRAVWAGGAAAEFRSARVQALLAWLALEAREPAPRRQLAALLWDGYLPGSALQSLRTSLHNLRHQLDPLPVLQIAAQTVAFDAGHRDFWCDALAFDALWEELAPHLAADAPSLSLRQQTRARAALALCREEFLAGLDLTDSPAFAVWVQQRRARYRHQAERLQRALTASHPAAPLVDWGEIPAPIPLYGRDAELAVLEQWLLHERPRLVGIYGIGGQGKTTLAAAAVRRAGEQAAFARIIWRSLLNAPPLDELLLEWVRFLSDFEIAELPASLDRRFVLLLGLLRRRPCLLVLDNLEALLVPAGQAGHFRPGYEAYGQLLARLADGDQPGCVLITSREQPVAVERLPTLPRGVRSLVLGGLSAADGAAILHSQGVQGEAASLDALVSHYSGNPLALLLAARAIQDLFAGRADAFLGQDRLIFADIRDVLETQRERLSPLEFDLLLWLAIEREPASIHEMQQSLAGSHNRAAVFDALRSLKRRLLVESYIGDETAAAPVLFGLQNVVLEYLTEWLVNTACQELTDGQLRFLRSHALLTAHARTFVRQSQERLLLQPILAQLIARWGRAACGVRLKTWLDTLRQDAASSPAAQPVGYAASNLLHLLICGELLDGADFAQLPVRGAYLRNVQLNAIDFTGADLTGAVFTDQLGVVRCVAADPRDRYIAAAAEDGVVWLWRKADQSLHQSIRTDSSFLLAISFSPDGRWLASAGVGGALSLWDVATGALHMQLQPAGAAVRAVAFSPDGAWLAATGAEGSVDLWSVATGLTVATLSGHEGSVLAAQFSPDGALLACADGGDRITLWDWRTGRVAARCTSTDGDLLSVAFHPTAPQLACSSGKGCVHVWDYARDATVLRLECSTVVYGVVFSADGRWIAGAGHDGLIYVWDAASGQRVALLSGHTHRVLALALCADGRTLISGGADQTLRVWDLPNARPLYELNGHRRSIAAMALSPARSCLAVVGSGLAVWLWEARTGAITGRWPAHERMITTCAFTPDGQILATGGSDQIIYLWDVASGRRLRMLEGHSQPVERVAFHPTLPLLASGGLDYSVRLWNVTTGQQRSVQSLHSSWVSDLAFSPDGRWLFSSAGDATLRCWALDAVHTLQPVAVLHVPDVEKGQGIVMALNPLRPLLAYATTQHVELLSLADHLVVARFANQSSWVTGLAFSPDGARLACVGQERMLRVWDVVHGHLCWEQESPAQVNSLLFAADGLCLFSGRADGCVDRWDVATGACVQTMRIPGPYQGMKIRAVTGITSAQRASLLALGAVEG